MPYIEPERRVALQAGEVPTTAGELNFAITMLINRYLQQKPLRYAHLNEIMGALECAKLELYRRIAIPYEDRKIEQNGDVYTIDETS